MCFPAGDKSMCKDTEVVIYLTCVEVIQPDIAGVRRTVKDKMGKLRRSRPNDEEP